MSRINCNSLSSTTCDLRPNVLCDALYLEYGSTMWRRFCSSSVSWCHLPTLSSGGSRSMSQIILMLTSMGNRDMIGETIDAFGASTPPGEMHDVKRYTHSCMLQGHWSATLNGPGWAK